MILNQIDISNQHQSNMYNHLTLISIIVWKITNCALKYVVVDSLPVIILPQQNYCINVHKYIFQFKFVLLITKYLSNGLQL